MDNIVKQSYLEVSYEGQICVDHALDGIVDILNKYIYNELLMTKSLDITSNNITTEIINVLDIDSLISDKGEIDKCYEVDDSWIIEDEIPRCPVDNFAKKFLPTDMLKEKEKPPMLSPNRILKPIIIRASFNVEDNRLTSPLNSTLPRIFKITSPDRESKSLNVTRSFKNTAFVEEDEFTQRMSKYNEVLVNQINELHEKEKLEEQQYESKVGKLKDNYILDRNGSIIAVNHLKNYKSPYVELNIKTYDIEAPKSLDPDVIFKPNQNVPKQIKLPSFIPRDEKNIVEKMQLSAGVKLPLNKMLSSRNNSVRPNDNTDKSKVNRSKMISRQSSITFPKVDKDNLPTTQSTNQPINDKQSNNKSASLNTQQRENKNKNKTENKDNTNNNKNNINNSRPPLSTSKPVGSKIKFENVKTTTSLPVIPLSLPSRNHRSPTHDGHKVLIEKTIRGKQTEVVSFTDITGREHLSRSSSILFNSDDSPFNSNRDFLSSSFSVTKTAYGERYLQATQ